MKNRKIGSFTLFCGLSLCLFSLLMSSCSPTHSAVVSIADQEMTVLRNGKVVEKFPVSTSKFGIGNKRGSHYTPLGKLKVARKIGAGAPKGAVFKSRKRTGEIIRPNAPGRDPIVTRILWLSGTEAKNKNTFRRYIYIHGTPEERTIGTPASYGCIRMKSKDIIILYNMLSVGSNVNVINYSLRSQRH